MTSVQQVSDIYIASYAEFVITGKTPSCVYVLSIVLACQVIQDAVIDQNLSQVFRHRGLCGRPVCLQTCRHQHCNRRCLPELILAC